LYQPDERPRKVEVDDDMGVLKVLSLGENVSGQEDAEFLVRGDCLVVASR
jgi:hypothetical protein